MNDISHLGSAGDVLADDLLLDRIGSRLDAGSEPVAGLLAALAAHADSPLPARTVRRRVANKHRYLGAFAALAVAASGAGVAAAVTLPDGGSFLANRDRIERRMEQDARSGAPSALLSRLGLPATNDTTAARGLVLARGANGTFVLLPAAAQAATSAAGQVPGAAGSGAAVGPVGAVGPAGGVGVGGAPAADPFAPGGSVAAPAVGTAKAPKDKPAKPAKPRPGTGAATGNGQGNGVANGQAANGQGANGQGANAQGDTTAGQTAGDPIWVIAPPAGTTGTAGTAGTTGTTGTTGTAGSTTGPTTTSPTDTTVAGPAPIGGRLAGSPNQQALVPPTGPLANRRAVVPGVGPSVTPGAAQPSKPAAPRSPNASDAAKQAVMEAAKDAAAAAAAAAKSAGASSARPAHARAAGNGPGATAATPATPAAGTPAEAVQPAVPVP